MSQISSPAKNFHDLFPKPGSKPQGVLGRLFWCLSSFWLAVSLLGTILVTVAVATIYEAQVDADYARYMIYGCKWFEAILVLLGINIIAAAFSRWPWKRRHTGFLITHLGLITTLTGATVSRYAGWNGQLALQEGEQGRTVRTKQTLLVAQTPDPSASQVFPVEFKYDPPSPEKPQRFRTGPYELAVDQYYAAAQMADVVEPGGEEFFPAVKIWFQAPVASAEPWLILRHPKKNRIDFGPAQFAFVEAEDEAQFQALSAEKPTGEGARARGNLHLTLANGEHLKVPVAEKFNQPFPLDGSGRVLTITEFHDDVVAEDDVAGDGRESNPALRFALYSPSEKEMRWEQWLFYYLPQRRQVDFGGVATLEMRLAETDEEMAAWLEPEAFLAKFPKGQLRLRLAGGRPVTFSVADLLESGGPVAIEDTDLRLEIENFYPHARVNHEEQQLENASDVMANPAILFKIHGPDGDEEHSLFASFPTFDRFRRSGKVSPYAEAAQLLAPVIESPERLGRIIIICGPGDKLAYHGFSKKAGRIRGSLELGKSIQTNWMDLELVVQEYFPRAAHRLALREAKAHEEPQQSPHQSSHHHQVNPAVRVHVEAPSGSRDYVAFGAESGRTMDTFPTGAGGDTGIAFLEYQVEEKEEGSGNSLTVVLAPDRSLHYVIRSRKHGTQSGQVGLKKDVALPWMPDAKFRIEEYIEKGRVRQEVVESTSFGPQESHMPAVRVQVRKNGETAEGWVWWGVKHGTEFKLGNEEIRVSLFYNTVDLDFDVKLIDFRDVLNPGGEGIASFESDVDFLDARAGLTQQVMISMNNPHEYKKLLFFQSSYVKQPGQPEISVFSVSYDPGIKVVYIGFSLVVCGIVTMFYIKPWQTPPRKPKTRKKV